MGGSRENTKGWHRNHFIFMGQLTSSTGIASELYEFLQRWLGRLIFLVILYTILGCILDVLGMTILTLPFVFPITIALGIDPIWFGVFMTIMTEIALITPPVGVNVFVMRSIATDVPMGTIFRGIVPFLIGEFLVITILILFPITTTWLPQQMK
jgi:TRAP-type C4-dicarboxylate transport system permease large subunit